MASVSTFFLFLWATFDVVSRCFSYIWFCVLRASHIARSPATCYAYGNIQTLTCYLFLIHTSPWNAVLHSRGQCRTQQQVLTFSCTAGDDYPVKGQIAGCSRGLRSQPSDIISLEAYWLCWPGEWWAAVWLLQSMALVTQSDSFSKLQHIVLAAIGTMQLKYSNKD